MSSKKSAKAKATENTQNGTQNDVHTPAKDEPKIVLFMGEKPDLKVEHPKKEVKETKEPVKAPEPVKETPKEPVKEPAKDAKAEKPALFGPDGKLRPITEIVAENKGEKVEAPAKETKKEKGTYVKAEDKGIETKAPKEKAAKVERKPGAEVKADLILVQPSYLDVLNAAKGARIMCLDENGIYEVGAKVPVVEETIAMWWGGAGRDAEAGKAKREAWLNKVTEQMKAQKDVKAVTILASTLYFEQLKGRLVKAGFTVETISAAKYLKGQ